MDNRHRPLRSSKATSPSEVEVFVGGVHFTLIRELLASKSEKLSALFADNKEDTVSAFLRTIPTELETFEIVVRFCHGFEPQISSDNAIPLICLSFYLGMTETQSPNNLCKKAIDFFEQRTLPSWNETLRALGVLSEKVIDQAQELGLIDACLESTVEKVTMDPRLLGKDDNEDDDGKPNARRKLFVPGWKSEELTVLPLVFYVPAVKRMKQHGVASEYLVGSLLRYAERWVFSKGIREDMSAFQRRSMREAMEAVEKLLPSEEEPGLVPCDLLFEMLRYSVALEAGSECTDGFEGRIGKQLDQATVEDLLIPFQGYAKEAKYDFGCVKRILKNFYGSSSASNASALIKVSNLIEDFLAEVAADKDLDIHAFMALAEMSVAASLGNHASSDGIYKAIDIYLEKHSYLIETEREDVCRVLDCQKMSREAREHAVQNERLPLRVVVQVLFMEQLSMRDNVAKDFENQSRNESGDANDATSSVGEEELRVEIERMNNKVVELERQCSNFRKEIECSNCSRSGDVEKKSKGGVWREIKRKLGCIGSVHDCTCQVKKRKMMHPRWIGL